MRIALATAATALALAAALGAAGTAKGTMTYKGKAKDFTVTFKYAYYVKGPDMMDAKKTVRRVILSATDLSAKINACQTMSCTEDDLTEGIAIDLDGGPRLLYWLSINNGLVQYSGTAEPATLKATTDTATQFAGHIAIDGTKGGGPKVDADFDSTLVKTLTKAR